MIVECSRESCNLNYTKKELGQWKRMCYYKNEIQYIQLCFELINNLSVAEFDS